MNNLFSYSSSEITAIELSLKVALLCTIVVLPVAVFIGWMLARKNFIGKAFIEGVLHLPLVLPPVTVGYILLVLLGRNGSIGSFFYEHWGIQIAFSFPAAVIAAVVVSFPLVTRSIRLSIELVDKNYEDAARTLGASSLRVFFSITLPLALPGVISGAILAFGRSLGEFGATISFAGNISGETQTLPLAIFSTMQVPGQEFSTLRLVVVSILLSLAAMIGAEYLNRRILKRRV
ncbi:molybdate ABC transporter permease subunit [Maribellus sp. YY47]|uniref:molybdate ABC transporter permease subunit n=1 Tax=Maribellus sp. YY47 TaxID=2929486 RepID=UPI002000E951|nr:molybdate ABC transporter permease subunit [Maribellus sp. YY47]MCK3686421.1 molybdate ABC transporter permease subunit [Maribellus sp. YY47]